MARVLSEGTRGHEIQSLTLARNISHQQSLSRLNLAAPWDWFLPRLLPGIGSIIQPQLPNDMTADLIISAGRRPAGVARWHRKNSPQPAKYIQILNPGYSFKDYDVVLVPEHDALRHPKVIQFRGNLHPFNPAWFESNQQSNHQETRTAVFLGNPGDAYFKQQFLCDLSKIRLFCDNHGLHLCGSPRLSNQQQAFIRSQIKPREQLWLTDSDGENPYQNLLARADKIFVTADSINMMNESGASTAALTVLARDFIQSKKHHRFIRSIEHRLSGFECLDKKDPLPDPVAQLLAESDLLKRLELA